MRSAAWLLAPLAAAALAAGCLETRHDYTLNPDGSGKVVYEVVFIPAAIGVAPQPEDPAITVRRSVRELMDSSRGVTAWKDVRYERRPDGRISFKGTAYFDDLAALKLHLMKPSPFRWRKDDGGMLLEMPMQGPEAGAVVRPPKLTAAQVAEEIAKQREEWKRKRTLIQPYIGSLRIDVRFRLPGRLRETRNFKEAPEGWLRLEFDGPRMFQAMEELVADDRFMEQAVRGGVNVLQGDPGAHRVINERVFGLKGPVEARVGGRLEPLFSYREEVAEAKAQYPRMMETLGLDRIPPPPVPPPDRPPPPQPKG